MEQQLKNEIHAAVLQRLLEHLQTRTDVQNIDLMNLSGFCRNCLSKWYLAACEERGIEMDYDKARTHVYGMDYDEWKQKHQTPATAEQMQAYKGSGKKSED